MGQTEPPVLDLDTKRPSVRIDGQLYELRTRDEFPFLIDRQRAQRYARLDALLSKSRRTRADQIELESVLNDVCRLVLIAPDAVHAKLRIELKRKVVDAFFRVAAMSPTTPATQKKVTGGKSPRG